MAVGSAFCACGGKNKHCFTCLVAGIVKPAEPKRIVLSRAVYQKTQDPIEQADGQAQYVRVEEPYFGKEVDLTCADCGVIVKDLEKHRSKVHGAQAVEVNESLPAADSVAKAPPNPLFNLQKCAVCGSMVGDLARHMKKAKHIDRSKIRSILVTEVDTGELICPFCPSRWPNRTEVSRHVTRAHGDQARATLRFATSPKPVLRPRQTGRG